MVRLNCRNFFGSYLLLVMDRCWCWFLCSQDRWYGCEGNIGFFIVLAGLIITIVGSRADIGFCSAMSDVSLLLFIFGWICICKVAVFSIFGLLVFICCLGWRVGCCSWLVSWLVLIFTVFEWKDLWNYVHYEKWPIFELEPAGSWPNLSNISVSL